MLNKILAAIILFTWFFGIGAAVLYSTGSWALSVAVVLCGLVVQVSLTYFCANLDKALRAELIEFVAEQLVVNRANHEVLSRLNQRVLLIESSEVEKH